MTRDEAELRIYHLNSEIKVLENCARNRPTGGEKQSFWDKANVLRSEKDYLEQQLG